MERFACNTMVISGTDGLSVLGEGVCKKILVMSQPEFLHGGQAEQLIKAAKNPKAAFLELDTKTVTMQQAVEASRRIREFRPERVVAVGSEAVLDWGKAAVCFSKEECSLTVIPTLFCAGEEVTDRVNLMHNGRRYLLRNRRMQPECAILDMNMADKRQREKIGESGFYLLAAAMEAYVCGTGEFLAALHAREAFTVCWAALPAACSGSVQSCKKLQGASVLAGMALNQTGLGLCHALQNSLEAVFGLSRGKAAGILLPAIIGCNAHAAGRRYAELSRAAGMGGSREDIGIHNLRAGLVRLRRELGLPGTLVQAGVDLRSVWNSGRRVVELTLEDPECRNNPVAVDDFMVRRILDEITGRF